MGEKGDQMERWRNGESGERGTDGRQVELPRFARSTPLRSPALLAAPTFMASSCCWSSAVPGRPHRLGAARRPTAEVLRRPSSVFLFVFVGGGGGGGGRVSRHSGAGLGARKKEGGAPPKRARGEPFFFLSLERCSEGEGRVSLPTRRSAREEEE